MVKGNLKSTEHVLLVIGNWNVKVGNGQKENVVGLYGLGSRKEAGESHSFLSSNNFFIANTVFKTTKMMPTLPEYA